MPSAPHAPRRGPCSCGSGRAALTCCLPWEEALQRLTGRLVAFAAGPSVRAERQEASAEWDAQGAGTAGGSLRFLEWFLLDRVPGPTHAPLAGGFADDAGELPGREEQLLFVLLLSVLRAYVLVERFAGQGGVLRDILSGAELPVTELGLPRAAIRADVLVGRVLPFGGTHRVGPSLARLPAAAREELTAYLHAAYRATRPGRHVALEDFLDGSAHLYHQFYALRGRELGGEVHDTLPAEPYARAGVRYAAGQLSRVRAALDRQPELEREPARGAEEARYVRVDLIRGIPRGEIALSSAAVEGRADTEREVDALGRFLEEALRGLVAMPAQPFPPAEQEAGTLPQRGRPGQAFLRRMLARWPETSSMLVGGVPREAMGSAAGRRRVSEVVAILERDLGRQKRLGRATADVAVVREALGLPPPVPPGSQSEVR